MGHAYLGVEELSRLCIHKSPIDEELGSHRLQGFAQLGREVCFSLGCKSVH